MAEYSVTFWLPFPPSTNRLWRSVGNRVILGVKYKEWKRNADSFVVKQDLGKSPVLGVYQLDLQLSSRFIKKGDADNRLKATHDFCKRSGLVVDDKFCRKTSVEWADTGVHDCLVTLTGEIAYKDQWEFAQAKMNSAKRG